MPIISTDIKYRLSGGAANADPLLSLGGAKSSTDAGADIFDDVPSSEATPGDIEYRCVYVHNAHATLAMLAPKIWVQVQTPSGDTDVAIGVGTSVVNANEQVVANENIAPTSVTFSQPANEAAGLTLGDIPAGQHRAVWTRRTINAAAAAANDTFTLRVKCDSNP